MVRADTIFPAVFFLFGVMVGSFLNVCIHRIPREESIAFPPSHCPLCHDPIRFYDNIPILSYLWLRGRCRHCRAPISFQYPLVEALSGMFSLVLYLRFPPMQSLLYFGFLSSLIVITFIDLKYQIIPDAISLPGIGLGFLASFGWSRISWMDSLLGLLLGGGILYAVAAVYYRIRKTEGMGGGDIKLLAMIGSFLGTKAVVLTIFTSSFLGSLVGIGLMIFRKKDQQYAIPYGPFLALGAVLSLFWGESLFSWYGHLVGRR